MMAMYKSFMDAHSTPVTCGAGISEPEIANALRAAANASLKKILLVPGLAYLAFAVIDSAKRPTEAAGILAGLAVGIGAASLLVWMLALRDEIPSRFQDAIVAGLGIAIIVHSLAKFYFTSDPAQISIVMVVLVGCAGTLASWGWLACVSLPALLGWAAVAVPRLPLSGQIYWNVGLAVTATFAAVGMRTRIQNQQKAREERLQKEMRERQERAERTNRERFELAVQATLDGYWYWDLKAKSFHFSPTWEALLGYESGKLESDPEEWFSRVHPGYLAELRGALANHLSGETDQFQHEHRLRRKDGTYLWVMARGTVVRDSSGEPVALAGSHRDITSLMEVEQRLLTDTFHDKLTGLPNRHFFMSRLELAMERKRNHTGRQLFAVMFLDLDRFKVINDSMGHLAGDQLLVAVATRLRNCARPEDIVARFGGDEFVILLDHIHDASEAMAVGNRIRKVLAEPFDISGREVTSGASIGIVLSTARVDQTEDLLKYADIAMYHAKNQRKGEVQVFDDHMSEQATKLCDLQNDLGRALERRELVLHYQPCVSVRSGNIHGVEALIRWRRSTGELLLPSDFIPLAEETGLINDIGEWAVRTACAQNRAWQQAGMRPVRMAVNLSAQQLQQKDFPKKVQRILTETGLDSRWLELELTETALMDSLDLAPGALEQLGEQGIRISIDDFGTGYSSLNYLRRFNFQMLKMDRCFMSDIATDRKAAAVARGVISLAHNLDLSVIAEGVEREDQLAFLIAEGCDLVQGYLASRPVPPEQMATLLRAGTTDSEFESGGPLSLLRALATGGAMAPAATVQ